MSNDRNTVFILILACLFLCILARQQNQCLVSSPGPVIGILTQEYWGDFKNYKNNRSYIAASYVKFVESAGGRVVPLLMDQSHDYYTKLMKNLNGVLLPGGGQYLNDSGYGRTGRIILQIARQINLGGDYFPVWATCLGFELLAIEESNGDILTKCKSNDQVSPIVFEAGIEELRTTGRMFKNLTDDLFVRMTSENVTINYHGWCLTKEKFSQSDLRDKYHILAIDHDQQDMEYISIIEGVEYPFFGVQFHPEKPLFEFVNREHHCRIPHHESAIQTGLYFANFFVNECRKSQHVFNMHDYRDHLIYNFQADYTIDYENFEQMYFLPLK